MSECNGIKWTPSKDEELESMRVKMDAIVKEKNAYTECMKNKIGSALIKKGILRQQQPTASWYPDYSDYNQLETIKGDFLIKVLFEHQDTIIEMFNDINKGEK